MTPYLHECVSDCAADMARDPEIARLYLPDGTPIQAGTRLITGDYAETLRDVASHGPDISIPAASVLIMPPHGRVRRLHHQQDLTATKRSRDPVRGIYRGFEIIGPPPPSSGPLHIIQMLNILEGFDIGALGFGTTETVHLLAEVLKIALPTAPPRPPTRRS